MIATTDPIQPILGLTYYICIHLVANDSNDASE
jgi:hypothetical protein